MTAESRARQRLLAWLSASTFAQSGTFSPDTHLLDMQHAYPHTTRPSRTSFADRLQVAYTYRLSNIDHLDREARSVERGRASQHRLTIFERRTLRGMLRTQHLVVNGAPLAGCARHTLPESKTSEDVSGTRRR